MSASTVEPWTFRSESAQKIRTAHYVIYTTIKEPRTLGVLPALMEGALRQYQLLAPDVPLSDKPMECYVFNSRPEWNDFTKDNTGRDAKVYLQIRKGGYTVGDRYVAYFIGPNATASVAAHEGWHQFVARNFKGRLPPFLEEGMACMFEGVNWVGTNAEVPRWNLSVNPVRAMELRHTMQGGKPWPLEQLIRMHAGEVVDQPGERIEAFYAQSWAFARFLWDAEGGRYRPAFRQWIAETASGEVFDPTHSHNRPNVPWNPDGVKPMMEHYLGMTLGEIDHAFSAYMARTVNLMYDDALKD